MDNNEKLEFIQDNVLITLQTRGRLKLSQQKTMRRIPDIISDLIVIFCHPSEFEEISNMFPKNTIIPVEHDNIGELRSKILKSSDTNIIMLDDSMKIDVRAESDKGVQTKYLLKVLSDKNFTDGLIIDLFIELFYKMTKLLISGDYGMVGLSHRPVNWVMEGDLVINKRIWGFWGVNNELYKKIGKPDLSGRHVKEDMFLQLNFLTSGIKTCSMVDFSFERTGSINSTGGVSRYRNLDVLHEQADFMVKSFPKYVKKIYKSSKSMAGFDTDVPDINVSWAKAYDENKQDKKNYNIDSVCLVDLNGLTEDIDSQAYNFKNQISEECEKSNCNLNILTFRDFEDIFLTDFPVLHEFIRENILLYGGEYDKAVKQKNGKRYTLIPLLADWIRYLYLYVNGGLYLDLDQDVVTTGFIDELNHKFDGGLIIAPDLGLGEKTRRKKGFPKFMNEDGTPSNLDYVNNHLMVCKPEDPIIKHCLDKIEFNFFRIEKNISNHDNIGIISRLLNQQLWAKNIFIGAKGSITVLDMELWNPKGLNKNWDEYKPKVRPFLFHHAANKINWKSPEGKSFEEAYKVGDFEKLWFPNN